MIGKISGRLAYRQADHVLIETPGGVGYTVHCSDRTLAQMPEEGGAVALFTELVVREDQWQLYGFLTLAERDWHRLLTSVQGVGAKAAMAILGTLGPEGAGRAITLGDAAAIKAAPGIGPKIAARVVNELKDKAPAIMALGAVGAKPAMPGVAVGPSSAPVDEVIDTSPATAPEGSANTRAEALSALVNLGYGQGEAAMAIAEVGDEASDTGTLIRLALRRLAPKG
ncbi:Holliday junction DNA helicase RuvA [Rubricella aquisinus]|uniref:Holliday junction branch migration complex subunit RuvA n=1 Tax=Rubricella aquisinus TaxID=2028108 RepID=A0A840WQM0_9RHOB|nr:Holliday junction branch migration protein RuvA [Rubricella aquisinus]MBB5515972.1 Holliday junction DNA helicase RuvA [Rubricella aquisinus]